MSGERDRRYEAPKVETLEAGRLVATLGPALAGAYQSTFEPNDDSCGFSMGQPCP